MTIPILLQKQRMMYSLQPQRNDFQVLVGQPETGHDFGKPCILLMTRSADQEIDELSLELAARNIAILRLDSDWCLGQEVCWDINRKTLITDQGTFWPILCWFRYFTSDSIQESSEAGIDKFVRSQWRAWSRSVLESSQCRKINATVGTLEIDRISQLLQAKATGLSIPKTVATTRLDLAVSALGNPSKLLIKSIGDHYVEIRPGSLQGLFPVELDIKDLSSENELAPMIAQEFITGCREIKIFVVGLNFFAFSLIKKSINTEWSDFSHLQAEPISMIEELATPLLYLMRNWSLDIACFDFIDTGSEYVFLEVNTMCDWLWIEQKTGDSAVSVAVLNLLVDLFTQVSAKFS